MRNKTSIKITTIILTALAANISFALPIDWHGAFGVDSTRIDTYRRSDTTLSTTPAAGDQSIQSHDPSKAENASYQSYLLKLQPSLIINDSVTINGEMTTGYGRGGFLGDSSTKQKTGNSAGNALYFQNTTTGDDLVLNKIYMELFADTATFMIGRYSKNWGLGVLFNGGDNVWDRHVSIHDGVDVKFKIGNFTITPHWTKISNGGTQINTDDVKDYGISALYDNIDKEIIFGVLYSKRNAHGYASDYATSSVAGSPLAFGQTDIKIWDFYLKKSFGKYTFAAEVPWITGEMGFVFDPNIRSDYKANAIIFENKYVLTDKWDIGLDLGQVTGDSGTKGTFEAMYLHPNYQVAYLMFRYNLSNFTDSTKSIYDSYITNARYLKAYFNHYTNAWTIRAALIYGVALETAKSGATAFDHEKNRIYSAVATQNNNLGTELDLGLDYNWNANVAVKGEFGYMMVGDYYKFINSSSNLTQQVSNSYIGALKVAVNF